MMKKSFLSVLLIISFGVFATSSNDECTNHLTNANLLTCYLNKIIINVTIENAIL